MLDLLDLIGIKTAPLTAKDRDLIARVLDRLCAKHAEEVHWPSPRSGMEGPCGERIWFTRRGRGPSR